MSAYDHVSAVAVGPDAASVPDRSSYVTRFTRHQRLEHFFVMTLFTLLVITGMPQKYPAVGFSGMTVRLLGGINATRVVHRFCGFAFSFATVLHIALVVWGTLGRRMSRMTMIPDRKDFKDAVGTLKYYLGLSKQHPHFDRYDYRQKFEYWGMLAGSVIMVVTGFVLYFPSAVARFLPGQLIPAAKIAHSYEGLLALLVVIVWHIYNAHLNPDVFPFDTSIFTGKISRERMEKEHPLELARLEGRPPEGS